VTLISRCRQTPIPVRDHLQIVDDGSAVNDDAAVMFDAQMAAGPSSPSRCAFSSSRSIFIGIMSCSYRRSGRRRATLINMPQWSIARVWASEYGHSHVLLIAAKAAAMIAR
jgi:hypothetical protein